MNLYTVSVPVFLKMLNNLKHILTQAKLYAHKEGWSEKDLLEAKLAPDMFPLTRQVQIASDAAKGIAAGLAGVQAPIMEDTEASLDALIERCNKTIHFLESLSKEQFDGGEQRMLPFRYVEGKSMTGEATLLQSNLPNFFFHVVVAYAILRHKGVPLGKTDYIGELPLQ